MTIKKNSDGSKQIGDSNVIVQGDQSIETPSTTEFSREIAEEAFMNEIVTVEIATTTDENQPSHVVLNVNGVNQPIFRGVPTPVKRKFVEVLARCKETKYTQHQLNPYEPDRIEMRAKTALVYPFQVLEDNNPKGRAWLQAILSEAA